MINDGDPIGPKLIWKWIISKYKNLFNSCDKTLTCVESNALEAPMCEIVLQIWDIDAPKPRF